MEFIAIANEMAQRKAADDMLNGRVDATATQAGITANTTWSELESAATQP